MSCASCGRELGQALRFCPMCGRRQSAVFARQSGTLVGALRETETLRDWRSVLEILVALCNAVTETRSHGVAELALEPNSFYLERRSAGWVAQVLDPGVEQPSDTHDTEEMHALPPWVIMVDASYWAPERLMNRLRDAPSDVYTLAVIAYELMTGMRPFQQARGPGDLIACQLKKTPLAPSLAQPDSGIPPACDALLLRCLDKERAKRFPDATALAAAIATILDSEPIAPPRAVRRAQQAVPPARLSSPIAQTIPAKPCGSKGCTIGHRLVAPASRTLVGSWLFADHYDTAIARLPEGTVHPHVGVATIAYLFDGSMVHRDSLGNTQAIERGSLSWMIAGHGLAHSERQRPVDRARQARLHGLEMWVVLPRPNEDDPGSYRYLRAAELPSVVIGGVRVRVLIGEGFGVVSPVAFPAPLAMYDVRLPANAAVPLPLPRYHDYQRAVYVVAGAVEIGNTVVEARTLVVLAPGVAVGVRASRGKPAQIIGLGSAPSLGPRHTWWTFSSSSRARIDDAKRRWNADEIGTVSGDTNRAPLPRG